MSHVVLPQVLPGPDVRRSPRGPRGAAGGLGVARRVVAGRQSEFLEDTSVPGRADAGQSHRSWGRASPRRRPSSPVACSPPPTASASAPGTTLPTTADADLGFVVAHGFPVRGAAGVRASWRSCPGPGGVVSFDFRGHGSRAGGARGRPRGARPGRGRPVGPPSRLPRLVPVGWSMGAGVAIRHAALHRGWTPWSPSAGRAAGSTGGRGRCGCCTAGSETRIGRGVLALGYRTRIARLGWDPWPEPPDALVGPDRAGAAARRPRRPRPVLPGRARALARRGARAARPSSGWSPASVTPRRPRRRSWCAGSPRGRRRPPRDPHDAGERRRSRSPVCEDARSERRPRCRRLRRAGGAGRAGGVLGVVRARPGRRAGRARDRARLVGAVRPALAAGQRRPRRGRRVARASRSPSPCSTRPGRWPGSPRSSRPAYSRAFVREILRGRRGRRSWSP